MKHCIQSLFYNIEQTARICRAGVENYFDKHAEGKISFDEFIILETVYCYPEICQRDLAKLILKGTSHTSKFLAVLEEKKFIERPIDTKGKRIVKKIIITPKGMEAYNFAFKIAAEYAKTIENTIGSKEAKNCEIFLNKIKQTVQKSGEITFE
ncbi:winged helix-turn-helix transcriptional regulator [bacterium]|nr:winged helix-turn-helix transcriptional regulator [bacterium]